MGRMYSIVMNDVSVSAAQDLFTIQPGDDKPIKIHSIKIANVGGVADAGDAREECLSIKIIRGHATITAGTAVTAQPLGSTAGAASGATCTINNTTIASVGTPTTLDSDGFNNRVGWLFKPTPEERPGVSQANVSIVVRLTNAISAGNTPLLLSGTVIFEEEG